MNIKNTPMTEAIGVFLHLILKVKILIRSDDTSDIELNSYDFGHRSHFTSLFTENEISPRTFHIRWI